MEVHVKILGIFDVVIGTLGLAISIVGIGILGGIAGINRVSGRTEAAPAMGPLGFSLMLLIFATSTTSVVAGIGLLKFLSWARTLALILSALYLLLIPIGTALGVYGLWVLLKRDTEPLFRRGTMQVT